MTHNTQNDIEAKLEGFRKEFVKDNGPLVEPSIIDPIGSAGPILSWLRTTLTEQATQQEGERMEYYRDGYDAGVNSVIAEARKLLPPQPKD